MMRSRDLFFLTLLSGFLFLIKKGFSFLFYPFGLFQKKSLKKESLIFIFIINFFSLVTKKMFYKVDKNLLLKGHTHLDLFLWKFHSLTRVQPLKISLFFTPLFFMNPLTDSSPECYISLQPLIKERIEFLGQSYPV